MKRGEKLTALWMGIAAIVTLAVVAGIFFLSIPHLVSIDESESVPREGVDFLVVEAYVSDVNVTVGGSEFQARLHGMALADERYRAHLVVERDEAEPSRLVIREQRGAFEIRLGGGEALTLDITIPDGFNTNVAITNTSGKVRAEGIDAHTWSISAASGDIEVRNCSFAANLAPEFDSLGAASVKSGSGRVSVDNVINDSVTVSSSSGTVEASNCKAGNLRVENISGPIKITGAETGGLIVSTSSGSIDADVEELRDEATLDSMSGSIGLALPGGLRLAIDASSVSGSVQQDYPSAEDGLPVVVATISGSIEVRAKQQ